MSAGTIVVYMDRKHKAVHFHFISVSWKLPESYCKRAGSKLIKYCFIINRHISHHVPADFLQLQDHDLIHVSRLYTLKLPGVTLDTGLTSWYKHELLYCHQGAAWSYQSDITCWKETWGSRINKHPFVLSWTSWSSMRNMGCNTLQRWVITLTEFWIKE